MKRWWRILLPLLLVILAAGGAVRVSWSDPQPPDLSRDEPPFCDMCMPPRSVEARLVKGTTSIHVAVMDGMGGPYDFLLHEGYDIRGVPPSMSYGARHPKDPAARPVVDDARGRQICIQLLKDYRAAGDRESMEAADYLSGEKPSKVKRLLHRFLSRF
jgi:hypothetical protein